MNGKKPMWNGRKLNRQHIFKVNSVEPADSTLKTFYFNILFESVWIIYINTLTITLDCNTMASLGYYQYLFYPSAEMES